MIDRMNKTADRTKRNPRNRLLLRLSAVWFVLCLTMAVLAQPAHAQEETLESSHADWLVKCGKPPGSKNRICWVEQKVTSEDRPNIGMTVTYLKPTTGEEGTLQIQAPLGVMLPRQLGLTVDGNDVGKVPFIRCFAGGCLARATVPTDLLKTLTGGSTAVFIIFDTPDSGIGIPISLKGLSPAISALNKLK